jgi:ABC-type multidrug transport system ATPase subunit
MDPDSKRKMWQIIASLSNNHTIILVSHAMEEVESLCDRIGIMIEGRFQFIGSIRKLKEKFGKNDYQVEFRCNNRPNLISATNDKSNIHDCLQLCHEILQPMKDESHDGSNHAEMKENDDFKDNESNAFIQVDEVAANYARLSVKENLHLGKALDGFETNKAQYGIHEYKITQTSLDCSFLKVMNAHQRRKERGQNT